MSDLTIKEKGRRERSRYFAKRAMNHTAKQNRKTRLRKSKSGREEEKSIRLNDGNISVPDNISMPEEIDIYDNKNRATMALLCQRIRFSTSSEISLDFSKVKKIYAAGMLLLYAEVAQKMVRASINSDKRPKQQKPEKVLRHVGFFDMIKGTNVDKSDITEPDIVNWRVAQGARCRGKDIDEFISSIVKIPEKDQQKLHISIKEIIGNSLEHAYPSPLKYGRQEKWVMFGQIDDEDKLTIVVGDLGVGIPLTITQHENFLSIARTKKALRSDSSLIRIAAEIGETSMNPGHRGKGLHQAIENINAIHGRVDIYSRKGHYGFPNKQSRAARIRNQLKKPINGTIIQIMVKIPDDWERQNEQK